MTYITYAYIILIIMLLLCICFCCLHALSNVLGKDSICNALMDILQWPDELVYYIQGGELHDASSRTKLEGPPPGYVGHDTFINRSLPSMIKKMKLLLKLAKAKKAKA